MNYNVDLEEDINKVWGITEDIKLLLWRYYDHPKVMTEDELWNAIAGIGSTLDLYCSKLWDDYCKKFELDDYAPPEKLAYREAMLAKWHEPLRAGTEAGEKAVKKATKKKVKK